MVLGIGKSQITAIAKASHQINVTPHHRTKDTQWQTLFALKDNPALPLQQRLRASVVQAILDDRREAAADAGYDGAILAASASIRRATFVSCDSSTNTQSNWSIGALNTSGNHNISS